MPNSNDFLKMVRSSLNTKQMLILLTGFLIWACSDGQKPGQYTNDYFEITDFTPEDTLFRISKYDDGSGEEFCYVNQRGDTIIPYGRFTLSFSDTILTYGIVVERSGENFDLIGINQKGQRLYEVQWFDNGPDYVEEGMFRVQRNGMVGYADTSGKIVIEPQFKCAYPFSNGKAKVAYDCDLVKDQEHTIMESSSWFFIDKNGRKMQ